MYHDPNQRPDEDFGQWNDRNRIAKENWERANNLNQPQPGEPFDWGRPSSPTTWGSGGAGGGGGGGGGELVSGCLGAVILVPALVGFACLYPMPILVALVAGVAVSGLLAGILDRAPEWVQIGGVILVPLGIGIAVFVGLTRLEQKLGRSALWRVPRHIVRLVLFGIVAHWIGIRAFGSGTNRLLYPHPLLDTPLYLAGLAGIVLLVHIVLTRKGLQEVWHGRLEALGLRK